MRIVDAPICFSCTHLDKDAVPQMKCEAFPEGIPAGILFSEVDHRVPHPGDHGIQFDQDPEQPRARRVRRQERRLTHP